MSVMYGSKSQRTIERERKRVECRKLINEETTLEEIEKMFPQEKGKKFHLKVNVRRSMGTKVGDGELEVIRTHCNTKWYRHTITIKKRYIQEIKYKYSSIPHLNYGWGTNKNFGSITLYDYCMEKLKHYQSKGVECRNGMDRDGKETTYFQDALIAKLEIDTHEWNSFVIKESGYC
jgi:hypothetical protein